MNCGCRYPVSVLTAEPCCRPGAEPICPLDRCEHVEMGPIPASVEPESTALFAQYRGTIKLLAEARERHARALEERRYAADLVMALQAESARLWEATEAAVAEECGVRTVEPEEGGEGVLEAVGAHSAMADVPDLG